MKALFLGVLISAVLICCQSANPVVLPKYGNQCGCWNETGLWCIKTGPVLDKLDWCCQNYYIIFAVNNYEEFTLGALYDCAKNFKAETQPEINAKAQIMAISTVNNVVNPEKFENKYFSRVLFYPQLGKELELTTNDILVYCTELVERLYDPQCPDKSKRRVILPGTVHITLTETAFFFSPDYHTGNLITAIQVNTQTESSQSSQNDIDTSVYIGISMIVAGVVVVIVLIISILVVRYQHKKNHPPQQPNILAPTTGPVTQIIPPDSRQ